MQKPWETTTTIYTSEAALLEGLRRQERDACTCLLKRFEASLHRLAARLVRDADEVEDVLQESFIKACQRIPSFEGRSGLGTWLHQIVVTTALMWHRRQRSNVLSLEKEQESIGDVLLAQEMEPDEHVLMGERRQMIETALQSLPQTLRAAFVLRDINGLSTTEAATTLGLSESALKVRLYRARLALRHALAPLS